IDCNRRNSCAAPATVSVCWGVSTCHCARRRIIGGSWEGDTPEAQARIPAHGRERRFRVGRPSGVGIPSPASPAGLPFSNSRMRRACAQGEQRMKNFQRCLLLAGLLASASAHAQKNPDLVAEEVVVTASRFEEKPGDQPIGVEVITSEQIRDSGARTVPELLSRQAGIYTRDNSGSPNQQIYMRGFGTFGDQNTLILVDGQRISENEQIPADLA